MGAMNRGCKLEYYLDSFAPDFVVTGRLGFLGLPGPGFTSSFVKRKPIFFFLNIFLSIFTSVISSIIPIYILSSICTSVNHQYLPL